MSLRQVSTGVGEAGLRACYVAIKPVLRVGQCHSEPFAPVILSADHDPCPRSRFSAQESWAGMRSWFVGVWPDVRFSMSSDSSLRAELRRPSIYGGAQNDIR